MSVTTKIQGAGLARDVAPEVGNEANALRRAENVVLRSPGVIETRPSFDLLYEGASGAVRALREFGGTVVIVEQDGSTWRVRNASTHALVGGVSVEPVDYNESETRFAEARQNLYLTTLGGVAAMESATSAVRTTGTLMRTQTDLAATASATGAATSCAYRIVFVRKDSNGYVRRSVPSQRIILTLTNAPQAFGTASRIYFPTDLVVGDQIELYRTISQTGISPRPEHYLALTYTLNATDIAQGYAGPLIDPTPDLALGAELYTDAGQLTAAAEKFPPPQAQAIAWWQRVMWYGRTRQTARIIMELQNLYYRGIPTYSSRTTNLWTFDGAGGAVATLASTAGISVGMHVTDDFGAPSAAPTYYIQPGTHVSSFVPNTSVTLSQPTYTPGTTPTRPVIGIPETAPRGLDAFELECGWTAGLRTIGVFTTERLRDGMYVCGSFGPTVADAFPAGTRVAVVGGAATASAAALTTGTGPLFFGDVVTVQGIEFYAWATPTDQWDPFGYRLFYIGPYVNLSANYADHVGPGARGLAMSSLCDAINVHHFNDPDAFPFATLIGDRWDGRANDPDANGLVEDPGTLATSLVLETDFATEIVVTCTAADAFPMRDRQTVLYGHTLSEPGIAFTIGTNTSDNPEEPNRVYFSALDEPEAVPLLNFIDIGSKAAPILALVPLRNALLVFKTDGLWRITGSGPTSWSVEPIDNTMTLLRPELVSVSQNKAYAWAKGGFYEVDEGGSRSLSAGKIDVELRQHALYLTSNTTHGAWVAAVQQRNIVLLGVPTNLGGQFTERVYCYHQTTNAWSEWPVSWSKVAESASLDRLYYSRSEAAAGAGTAEIDVEVRRMLDGYTGIDRSYPLGDSLTVNGNVITIQQGDFGSWRPVVGDWISASDGGVRVYRRISAAAFDGGSGVWTLTLEAQVSATNGDVLITDAGVFFVTDGGVFFLIADLLDWQAHEAIRIALEWHPSGPASLPTSALAREMQFQLDLRDAPSESVSESLPEYVVGASTEREATVHTITSNMARLATVQPLRVGVSRQVARGALLAPYFQTSDVYPIRLTGASIVYEGVSERSRR